MGTCEILPNGRHRHHIGPFEPRVGFLDICRSLLRLTPPAVEGVNPSEVPGHLLPSAQAYSYQLQDAYANLPFQPEQRLIRSRGKMKENEYQEHSSDESTSSRGYSSVY